MEQNRRKWSITKSFIIKNNRKTSNNRNGVKSPCQGEGRGFESRFPLQFLPEPEPKQEIRRIAPFCLILPIFAFSSRVKSSPSFCGKHPMTSSLISMGRMLLAKCSFGPSRPTPWNSKTGVDFCGPFILGRPCKTPQKEPSSKVFGRRCVRWGFSQISLSTFLRFQRC